MAATVLLFINRSYADSFGFTDTASISPALGKSDQVSFVESLLFESARIIEEQFSLSDSPSLSIDRLLSDGSPLSDVFDRTVTFERSFSDAFALDDLFNGGLVFTENKSNVFGMTDTFSYNMILGNNAVLNASALNTYTLNR